VIRRILRRAVRYGYQTLGFKEPFICKLVPVLAAQMGEAFPELKNQQSLIEKVIFEEENSFFKTLANGLVKIESLFNALISAKAQKVLPGTDAFELYDTYGFPIDLTELIARESGFTVDRTEFDTCMGRQKNRSREATAVETGDWVQVLNEKLSSVGSSPVFVGYEKTECQAEIVQYRKVKTKNKELFQLVLDKTPFYAESGGQVGDTGYLDNGSEKISIADTKKENGITVHFADKLPKQLSGSFKAVVNTANRRLTENNHSATHLLHAALRRVLGTHVEQKGSLVNQDYLRFDFSHFAKVTDEELAEIGQLVNEKIRENISSEIKEMPIEEAKKTGAMALFGEKYGERVRVVTFDKAYSIELCGGTHVKSTGQIGLFKIISESAVAAGIRRIEAITSVRAEAYFAAHLAELEQVKILLGNPKDVAKVVQDVLAQNAELRKLSDALLKEKAQLIKAELMLKAKEIRGIRFISEKIILDSADAIKDMSFELKNEVDNLFLVLGAAVNGKPSLSVIISDKLVKEQKLNAGQIVRELAKEIKGGGGGQAFYATAGGTDLSGLERAIGRAEALLLNTENVR
jgi:alanyl-tRNA synthetase